ncbi:mCG1050281 [Mus musculus]|nr:mCG1050281 [Mus musculus]
MCCEYIESTSSPLGWLFQPISKPSQLSGSVFPSSQIWPTVSRLNKGHVVQSYSREERLVGRLQMFPSTVRRTFPEYSVLSAPSCWLAWLGSASLWEHLWML